MAEGDRLIVERAFNLAYSGGYSGWLAIEQALRSEGFSQASQFLDDGTIRAELNTICSRSRMGTYRYA